MPRLPLLSCVTALLMVVTACGGDDPEPAAQANTPTPTPTTSVTPRTTEPDDPAAAKEEPSPTDDATDATAKAGEPKQSKDNSGSANDGASDDTDQEKPAQRDNTVTVAGGPFEQLSFGEVECMGDAKDFFVQTQSSDPIVIVTVLFTGGKAVHTSAQTDPDSGESTIWSDENPDALAKSVHRDDDVIKFEGTSLAAFDDDSTLTLSGTLTCTSTTA